MATPPDFSSGAVLTAAQMNSVGLWLVKTQTVGNAVFEETVTGAFSSDFENYLVTLSGGVGSADQAIALNLTGSTTAYYGFLNYGSMLGNTPLGANINNGAAWTFVGGSKTGQAAHMSCQIMSPNLTRYTKCVFGAYQNGDAYGSFSGEHRVATAYTGFRIVPGVGTLTGGTIRVYGYRN
jgi:hypothetical protein